MKVRRGAASVRSIGPGIVFCVALVGCGGTLDAGADRAQDELPFGPDNPIILLNDNVYDNWHGEYAALLARANGATLAGIVIGTGSQWQDLDANLRGWEELVLRARESGLENLPDPLRSEHAPLARPDDGAIESTPPNDSAGARFIIETSLQLAEPGRPVLVAAGTRLTDVADAYLLDPSVAERILVVGSIGSFSEADGTGRMGAPNGEEDPWAGAIVVQRLPYVQVSAHYDQLADLPSERLSELPSNPFGEWMRAKQPDIFDIQVAVDQVSVLAPGLRAYVKSAVRMSQSGWQGDLPALAADPEGSAWVVTASDGAAATERFWELLLDPTTFSG